MHRFLSRRDKKSKVNIPATSSSSSSSSLLHSFSFPLLPSFFCHDRIARRNSRHDSLQDESGYGHERKGSASSSCTRFDLSFSLDGAASIRRPRKRPASVLVAQHTAQATTADCDLGLTLQSTVDIGAFGGLFIPNGQKKPDKDEEKKVSDTYQSLSSRVDTKPTPHQIKAILAQLQKYGITTFTEANVDYALRAKSSAGNPDQALRLLFLFEDTYEGIVRPYNPHTKLLGAENRSGVTCYLDALLFAMFARLDSFEAMLYNTFEDLPRKRLAGLLRLWVNMLRSGILITTDVVSNIADNLEISS